jgi:hypothetical protein
MLRLDWYGNNVTVGCRNIAAVETDEDEQTFWLELADKWERRHPPADNREVEKSVCWAVLGPWRE